MTVLRLESTAQICFDVDPERLGQAFPGAPFARDPGGAAAHGPFAPAPLRWLQTAVRRPPCAPLPPPPSDQVGATLRLARLGLGEAAAQRLAHGIAASLDAVAVAELLLGAPAAAAADAWLLQRARRWLLVHFAAAAQAPAMIAATAVEPGVVRLREALLQGVADEVHARRDLVDDGTLARLEALAHSRLLAQRWAPLEPALLWLLTGTPLRRLEAAGVLHVVFVLGHAGVALDAVAALLARLTEAAEDAAQAPGLRLLDGAGHTGLRRRCLAARRLRGWESACLDPQGSLIPAAILQGRRDIVRALRCLVPPDRRDELRARLDDRELQPADDDREAEPPTASSDGSGPGSPVSPAAALRRLGSSDSSGSRASIDSAASLGGGPLPGRALPAAAPVREEASAAALREMQRAARQQDPERAAAALRRLPAPSRAAALLNRRDGAGFGVLFAGASAATVGALLREVSAEERHEVCRKWLRVAVPLGRHDIAALLLEGLPPRLRPGAIRVALKAVSSPDLLDLDLLDLLLRQGGEAVCSQVAHVLEGEGDDRSDSSADSDGQASAAEHDPYELNAPY